ncbi:MAG: ABC transporter permease [Candidatus Thiodiazotropha sp.]
MISLKGPISSVARVSQDQPGGLWNTVLLNDSLTIANPSPDRVVLRFLGDWTLAEPVYAWDALQRDLAGRAGLQQVDIDTQALGRWDSRLLVMLKQIQCYCDQQGLKLDLEQLPDGVHRLLGLSRSVADRDLSHSEPKALGLVHRIGVGALAAWQECVDFTEFAGELILAMGRLLRGKSRFRWVDLFSALQAAGPEALPIVSLIAILVGAVLAFVGAIQLQMFGAEIYVANLVALGAFREMGAMMTAIIMAGRTGSAYAAQIGTMQVNDELDALKTFGIPVIDFLVLPRILALVIMLPLLTIWANLLGILGGMLVGVLVLDLSLLEYLTQTHGAIGWDDLAVGLVKSVLFGIVIAMSGCLRGLQCGRDSSAVGRATTSAMVTAILLIVIWDAITTILFNRLGI